MKRRWGAVRPIGLKKDRKGVLRISSQERGRGGFGGKKLLCGGKTRATMGGEGGRRKTSRKNHLVSGHKNLGWKRKKQAHPVDGIGPLQMGSRRVEREKKGGLGGR